MGIGRTGDSRGSIIGVSCKLVRSSSRSPPRKPSPPWSPAPLPQKSSPTSLTTVSSKRWHARCARRRPQDERDSYRCEGDVAEEDIKLIQVEGDDGDEHQYCERRGKTDAPTGEEPESDYHLEHAEGVQKYERANRESCLRKQGMHECRKVCRPRDRVRERRDRRIEEGEGQSDP